MKTVVGIKFKKTGRTYYFDPGDLNLAEGDGAIVETGQGQEYGDVVMGKKEVGDDAIISPLKSVLRKATELDYSRMAANAQQEKNTIAVFEEKIQEHHLEMKAVDLEYAFDGSKITFFFTADGRVDFRELVKDLAHHFRARIELRQIGVRDEAKMLGGLGKCGQPVCCARFLTEFSPVSIKMAKEQNISLNPTKISGLCGRLMCCLGYEQCHYQEMNKKMPKHGTEVMTPDGSGTVVETIPLTGKVKVRIERADGTFVFQTLSLEDLSFGKNAHPRPRQNREGREKPPAMVSREKQEEEVSAPLASSQREMPSSDKNGNRNRRRRNRSRNRTTRPPQGGEESQKPTGTTKP